MPTTVPPPRRRVAGVRRTVGGGACPTPRKTPAPHIVQDWSGGSLHPGVATTTSRTAVLGGGCPVDGFARSGGFNLTDLYALAWVLSGQDHAQREMVDSLTAAGPILLRRSATHAGRMEPGRLRSASDAWPGSP